MVLRMALMDSTSVVYEVNSVLAISIATVS
jgi:hypothetical protein